MICERAIRCGAIAPAQRAECLKGEGASRLTLVWGFRDMLRIGELAAAGRLVPIPGADQACLEYLSQAPCRIDLARARQGCGGGGVPPGLGPGVRPGGACVRSDECIDGHCTAAAGCTGVCVARVPLGGDCSQSPICAEGSFCWQGQCRARADVGEVCEGHWQWCKDGLFCDGYAPATRDEHFPRPARPGRCSAGRRLGEPCALPDSGGFDSNCAAPLVCDWGRDRPVCAEALPEGAECRALDVCGDGLVCAGLVLGGIHPAGGRYAARRPGRCARARDEGAPCDPDAFVDGCAASMRCDAARRVCRSTGHEGDPCASSWVRDAPSDAPHRNEACFGAHYCDVATRTCKRQLPAGARCRPVPFGVEDDPCFLGECSPKTRRCVAQCGDR